ncbi:hypothetical protein AAFF_G00423850 [Aldrovandia affinis]|uniref:Uncharacterized protein n=1 Tax=Aldrovandia affinis TaxID=143900 RepID=A0AAD7T6S6_9TELE|nr:hypothetical protein AAFF_G00423850 [Aldrovandia affinis]
MGVEFQAPLIWPRPPPPPGGSEAARNVTCGAARALPSAVPLKTGWGESIAHSSVSRPFVIVICREGASAFVEPQKPRSRLFINAVVVEAGGGPFNKPVS